jgi:single-strand DNA-binding protein
MKNLTIAGRLTKDAETRDAGGSRVTGFSVAVDNWDGKTKGTLFFDGSWWGDRGEKMARYLTKGTPVTVSGDLGTREHNGKTYLTIRVADVTLQGGKAAGGGGESNDGFSGAAGKADARAVYDMSDDIPFARLAMHGEA